jgi:cysteine desulfurase
LAKAIELATNEMDNHRKHFIKLRKKLISGLDEKFGDRYHINGDIENGVPHVINISFRDPNGNGIDGEMLILNLDVENICVSNGSACTSGAMEPSHVLSGIGLDDEIANSSIRISLGKQNTLEEIDYFLDKIEVVIKRMMPTEKV